MIGGNGSQASFVVNGSARLLVRRDGSGRPVVLLPSQGRDSDDYDEVAHAIARAGYLVLRPQPRGIGDSVAPLQGVTLHDLASDVAAVIASENLGKAIVLGHAFGHYVARMLAHAFPERVAGIIVAASAAKTFPDHLSRAVSEAGDAALPEEVRLAALRLAFFAPGNDPRCWLEGWHPRVTAMQRTARLGTPQASYWAGGDVPLLDLQAEFDPFKPPERRNEMREEFGSRISIKLIRNASHALLPEQPLDVAKATVEWMREIGYH